MVFAHIVPCKGPDEEGYVFVDRSGHLFEMVLQFLRTQMRPSELALKMHGDALLQECAFYGLESFPQKIRGETCLTDLLPNDRSIRAEETAARADPKANKQMLIHVVSQMRYKM